MSNIIINSFDGNNYTQLLPNANQAVFANNSQNATYATTANNSQQLGGVDSSQYATKQYVDGTDPLFARHKKIVTLSSGNIISFPQIETKKIISIIYRINNFSASIVSGKSEESTTNLNVNFMKDSSYSSSFLIINNMNAKDIRINTIIQKQAEFASTTSSLFLRSASSGGLVFDYFPNDTTFINGASLEFNNGYFLFRNGNIDVWIRTIDD